MSINLTQHNIKVQNLNTRYISAVLNSISKQMELFSSKIQRKNISNSVVTKYLLAATFLNNHTLLANFKMSNSSYILIIYIIYIIYINS